MREHIVIHRGREGNGLGCRQENCRQEIVSDTLNVILKYEGDVKKAQNELAKLLEKKSAEAAADKPQAAPAPASQKKGILH